MELTGVGGPREKRSIRRPWSALRQRLELLPREEPLGRVDYTVPLVSFVAGICLVAVVVAILTVRPVDDWTTLILGSLTIALFALYSVRSLTGVNTSFSASIFVHLGLTLVVGPLGAAAGAIADSIGNNSRLHPGWFRTLFNTANYFLANVAAWAAFNGIIRFSSQPLLGVVAGLSAGTTQGLVNLLPLACVLRLATRGEVKLFAFLRRSASMAPYFLGYGLAAYAFVLLHNDAGPIGFMLMIIPMALLQGFLVFLARRMHRYEEETKAHQEARVRLLQRAIDASNEERDRIAASIHDGVVQDLAGLSFTLGAYADMDADDLGEPEKRALLSRIQDASEAARRATRDLRTLIIEIVPPKLREQGLKPALEDLLANVGSGPATQLEIEDGSWFGDGTNSLIYRVAQEAVRNSIKYAHAEHLNIRVARQGDDVVLRVMDDGRGFDPAEQERQLQEGHVGLGLLQRTVADGGGSLRIESLPGRGTVVEMRAPTASPHQPGS